MNILKAAAVTALTFPAAALAQDAEPTTWPGTPWTQGTCEKTVEPKFYAEPVAKEGEGSDEQVEVDIKIMAYGNPDVTEIHWRHHPDLNIIVYCAKTAVLVISDENSFIEFVYPE